MEKNIFFDEIKDILELEGKIDGDTPINLTSLQILTIIMFFDENFNLLIKNSDLNKVKCINDLISLAKNEIK
jgi:acyl carrier protein